MEDFKLYKQVDILTETLYSVSSQVKQQQELIKLLQEKINLLYLKMEHQNE